MSMARSLFVAVVFAAAGSSAYGTNLLNNAGFENPLGFDFSDPSNWNGFFGGPAGTFLEAFNTTGATPLSGSAALVTTIRGVAGVTDGNNAFTGHVQIVNGITPGLPYELSVWARTNPSVNNGAEFRVEWQDGGGAEIARFNSVISPGLTSAYQQFSFMDVAPAGAVRAAIVLAVQSFTGGTPADTSVAWDDASFRLIPSPGAVGLVCLGGLFAGRRRR